MADEIEFRYDTQILLDVENPSDDIEDELDEYIRSHFKGDSLLVIADEDENGFTAAKGATFLQSVYEPVFAKGG